MLGGLNKAAEVGALVPCTPCSCIDSHTHVAGKILTRALTHQTSCPNPRAGNPYLFH